ncbi:MAG: hypothetical protein AB1896_15560 [Thermodesulfobacteriota bacterium]
MLTCGQCQAPLTGAVLNQDGPTPCPTCGVSTLAHVYPAYFRAPSGPDLEATFLFEDEAACFFHPGKKALVPCAQCGRFLCALCDVEMDGRHLCPLCIETGQRKHRINTLENRRLLYDRLALALVFVPTVLLFLFIYFWPLTAAAAIFVAVYFWRAPSSLLPRSKVRHVLAVVLALAQLTLWVMMVAAIFF